MSTYNQRQYRLMLNRVDAYREGNLDLSNLINDLDALLQVLQDTDGTWKRQFHRYWAILEDTYAWSLDKGLKHFLPEDKQAVDDAVGNIRQLLFGVLDGRQT